MKKLVAMLALFGGAWVGQAQVQTQGWILADTTWSGSIDVVGDVMITNNVTLTISAGSTVTFMSNSLAIYIPGTDSGGRLRLTGESGNRIKVTSVPGLATNGTLGRYPNLYAKELRAEYVDFSNLGSYTSNAQRSYSVFNAPNDGDLYIVRGCTFSNCYEAMAFAYHANAMIEISGNDFRYSATNLAIHVQGNMVGTTTNRQVFGNTADSGITLASSALVYSNSLVGSNAFLTVGSGASGTLVEKNYVHVQRNAGSAIGAAASNTIVRNNYMLGARECLAVSAVQYCTVEGNVMQAMPGQTRHISGLAGLSVVSGNILFGAQPANESILLSGVRTNLVFKNNVVASRSALTVSLSLTTGVVSEVHFRNNIFYHGGAALRPVITYSAGLSNVIASTDFNCFYSTNAAVITNYSVRVSVEGKTNRQSVGFGYNDLTVGGPAHEQVDPLLAGPIDAITVATPEEMLARIHTIDEVLAEARAAFALQAGSPCIDAGDPADDGEADVVGGQRDIGLEYGIVVDPGDDDSDGMVDSWEQDNFGSLTNAASGDVDADGFSNVEEFIAQTQPTNASSRFEATALTNGLSRFIVVPSVTGRAYRLWSTPTLVPTQSWSEVAGPVAGNGSPISLTDGITTNWAVYRLTVEMAAP